MDIQNIIESSETYSEMLRKLGWKVLNCNYKKIKKLIIDNKYETKKLLSMSEFTKKYHTNHRESKIEDVLVENSSFSRTALKVKLYKHNLKKRRCEMCGQGELWKEKKMSLILDHINGISDDNRIENLRILCPNCNATLDTHCGKNNKIKLSKPKVVKDILFHLKRNKHLRKCNRPELNILEDEVAKHGYSATGRKYGVSDNAVRKWIKMYKLVRESHRPGTSL